jgi:hypothetical protein
MSDIERIRGALSFIPPDSPEILLRMGTAIKDGLGDEGFWVWNEWVQQADPSVRAAAGATLTGRRFGVEGALIKLMLG